MKTSASTASCLVLCVAACGAATTEPPAAPSEPQPEVVEEPQFEEAPEELTARERQLALARGGRLFDKWWVEAEVDFVPDDKKTEEVDGKGGPFGDGTLPGADGKPVPNTGHDYRLKNLFGWDLRGHEGIYGEAYQNKAYVLPINLLTDETSREDWIKRLTDGGDGVPAYGKVLSAEDIGLIVDFIVAMRTSKLAGPGAAWELSAEAPKNYTLLSGGNAQRGHGLIQEKCANCHGKDGTKFYIDDKYSMGMYGRLKGYEAWIKVLNGQPGTKMGPQLSPDVDAAGQAMMLKDVFAALCDRTLYPKGQASADDAEDGDARCGELLK